MGKYNNGTCDKKKLMFFVGKQTEQRFKYLRMCALLSRVKCTDGAYLSLSYCLNWDKIKVGKSLKHKNAKQCTIYPSKMCKGVRLVAEPGRLQKKRQRKTIEKNNGKYGTGVIKISLQKTMCGEL